MEDSSSLVWGMLFGALGLGYWSYGKRQKQYIPYVCGLALMVFPYFVADFWLLLAIGFAISAVPYFIRY
jgi:hypothetical protein